jgi:DNA-binding MurR/RpiR family transcriptional regulator
MTLANIAWHFKCSESSIIRFCKKEYKKTFEDCYKYFSSGGEVAIRRAQLVKGIRERDTAMLKFLGVNYLKQRLTQEVQVNAQGGVGGSLVINMGSDE